MKADMYPAPDPAEARLEEHEWTESLDYVIKHGGPERVRTLLRHLQRRAAEFGIDLPFSANTPYINTIARAVQPRPVHARALLKATRACPRRWSSSPAHRVPIGLVSGS